MKKYLIFIAALSVFFFFLNMCINKPSEPLPVEPNQATVQQTTSPSPNGAAATSGTETPKPSTGTTQSANTVKENTAVTAAKTTTAPGTLDAASTSAIQSQEDYTAYQGRWLYGNKVTTAEEVRSKGGIIVNIKSYDAKKSTVTVSIQSIQEPPMNRIASVEFTKEVRDGVIYFDFTDDGFGNAGNGIITLNNGTMKLSVSIDKSGKDGSGWCLGNGLFTLRKSA